MVNKISDETQIAMPLKNIIAIVVGAAIGTWAYFGITERLTFLEHNADLMMVEIEENDNWIDDWKPPSAVQATINKTQELETLIALLQLRIELLEKDK